MVVSHNQKLRIVLSDDNTGTTRLAFLLIVSKDGSKLLRTHISMDTTDGIQFSTMEDTSYTSEEAEAVLVAGTVVFALFRLTLVLTESPRALFPT